MTKFNEYDIQFLIEKLQKGEPIPEDYKYKLFPIKQKEYELVYAGKMRKEDILANEDGVFPVPLQVEKVFNGEEYPPLNSLDKGGQKGGGWRNMIVFGDNLQFLKTVYENKDPLIKDKVKGRVKLIYIDPPFATESDFEASKKQKAYTDKAKGAEFIEFLRRRLVLAKEIMADDGNIIVHLDNKKSHYIKLILDEIFGENNFINEIIWHKGREGGSSRSHSPSASMPTEYQNLLIYSKDRKTRYWKPILGPYKESTVKNILKDEKGWYYMRGRMGRKPAEWEVEAGVALKTYVLLDPTKTKEEVIKLITSKSSEFVSVGDVWNNEMVKFSLTTKYPTEKPEDILKYLITAGTTDNELVLDFFSGSGTTAAVAEKLGRRWIACDIGKLSFYTMQKRILTIENSKDLENPKLVPSGSKTGKKYGKKAKSFVTVNTGLYDLQKVFKLKNDDYIKFVMNLFEVEPVNKKISGIKIDGQKKDGYYVLIYPYWEFKKASVDKEYLEDLHSNIGKRVGGRLYIIAPANYVDFISDYHEIEKTRYYFLKVPYQIIKELHKVQFKKFRQPQSKRNVNDLDDAVGFHFIRQPEVESKLVKKGEGVEIHITKFLSNYFEEETGSELKNFESLAMALIDKDYNDREFVMDEFYFAEDLLPKKKKTENEDEQNENEIKEDLNRLDRLVIQLNKEDCGDKVMVVYVDIYGNEFKEVLSVKK